MGKEAEMKAIAKEIANCSECKKGKSGLPVPGEGNTDAKIMFLGEAPGYKEAETGRPFIGRAGKFLDKMLAKAGIIREDVFITSPVKYFPGSRAPTLEEMRHGMVHTRKQIEAIKPKLVVLMGNTAVRSVLDEKLNVCDIHGKTIEKDGINYFPTIHPSAAMRFTGMRTIMERDFAKLASMTGEKKRQIILASLSPRRKEILERTGLKFHVRDSGFTENIDKKLIPRKMAEKLSYGKAAAVSKFYKNSLIIGADTIVVLEGKILGKPKDASEANSILKMLSGKSHIVITAFTIIDTVTNKSITKSVQTKVFMKNFSNDEIEHYIKTGEPMDKAGAYGIQGKGGLLVERIEGDYDNVVGLPIQDLMKELRKFGIVDSG